MDGGTLYQIDGQFAVKIVATAKLENLGYLVYAYEPGTTKLAPEQREQSKITLLRSGLEGLNDPRLPVKD